MPGKMDECLSLENYETELNAGAEGSPLQVTDYRKSAEVTVANQSETMFVFDALYLYLMKT